jgi:hypothetical protein
VSKKDSPLLHFRFSFIALTTQNPTRAWREAKRRPSKAAAGCTEGCEVAVGAFIAGGAPSAGGFRHLGDDARPGSRSLCGREGAFDGLSERRTVLCGASVSLCDEAQERPQSSWR